MSGHVGSSSVWSRLFEAALEFKEAQPWEHLTDRYLFGVQGPGAGPILHCAVMGAGGEVFGLAVYPGAEGLRAYERTVALMLEKDREAMDIQTQLRALTVSFDNKEDLDEADIDLIRSLGLTFSGPHGWPMFRSYEPGYVEVLPNEEERDWLLLALKGARELVGRLRKQELPDLDQLQQDELVVLRLRSDGADWAQEIKALDRGVEHLEVPAVDELKLQRLSRSASRGGVWEAAAYWMPMAVEEGDVKPFYPLLCAWADHNTGIILHHKLTTPSEGLGMLQISGIELMEQSGRIPETLLVQTDKAVRLLEPVAEVLQIELTRVKTLEIMSDAITELTRSLQSNFGADPVDMGEEPLMDSVSLAYAELIELFDRWLRDHGYAMSTRNRHIETIEVYLNGFLMEHGPLAPDQGLFQAETFFVSWLPDLGRWSSRQRIENMIPGLKKFAAFLRDAGLLEDDDLQDFLDEVKAGKEHWVDKALGMG